jgi:hypothetical protein
MPTTLRDWILVLWPAFFAACLLEILVFAAFDPRDADLFGWGLALEPISIYSLAFLAFWAITAATGVVTWSLTRSAPTGGDGEGTNRLAQPPRQGAVPPSA